LLKDAKLSTSNPVAGAWENRRMAEKPWFVYLIECHNGSIYTGIAVDVAARYAAHAEGRGARYTRMHPPRRLLAAFACRDRSEASRAEAAIKRCAPAHKPALAAASCVKEVFAMLRPPDSMAPTATESVAAASSRKPAGEPNA
jgi:putative endonuclease